VALVDAVEETCVMSHHTSEALAAAATVAALVSSALDGSDDLDRHLELALEAAHLASARGSPALGRTVPDALRDAVDVARSALDDEGFLHRLDVEVGTSVAAVESVPAAVACLVRADGDPWRAAVLGASAGGDCDTIASMAAGMAGAISGLADVPAGTLADVVAANGLDLVSPAAELVAIRRAPPTGAATHEPAPCA
jgi:ADP-ribosylglycohydrolase